jgi:hypothetical protein
VTVPTESAQNTPLEAANTSLVSGFSAFLYCSHFRIVDWLFEYLHIGMIAALCWGLVQGVLTYYFFPEILQFLMVTVGIHFAIPQALLYLAVAATFTTLFMIGKSVRKTRVCEKIQAALTSNSSLGKTLAIMLILLITHFLAFGYILEWFAKASMLLPIPAWASWIICSLAIMNLLLFSVERCMNTINIAFETKHDEVQPVEPAYRRVGIRIGLNVSMHLVLFTTMGILPLNYLYPLAALGIFFTLYATELYDSKKSFWQNVDDIIYDWVFLITHASAEGGVAAAGICLWLQQFVVNTNILHLLVIGTLIASTACEELEDMVHTDDDATHMDPLKHHLVDDDLQKLAQVLCSYGMEEEAVKAYLNIKSRKQVELKKTAYLSVLLANLPLKDIIALLKKSHLSQLPLKDLFKSGKTEGQWLQADMPLYLFSKQRDSYVPYIDKWLRINMLMLFFVCLTGFTPFTITLLTGVNAYYLYQIAKRFNHYHFSFRQSLTELWRVGSNRLFAHILFYACMTTALCLGINGGLEFLHMCGTSIGMVFFIAIAGVIIESSVFFDQIKSGEEALDEEEVKFPIFSFLMDAENLLTTVAVLASVSSIACLLTLSHIVTFGTAVCVAIGMIAVYGDDLFNALKYALCAGNTLERLLAFTPLIILFSGLCVAVCGSTALLLSMLPYVVPVVCVASLVATHLCIGKTLPAITADVIKDSCTNFAEKANVPCGSDGLQNTCGDKILGLPYCSR